jgi:hypothetical protein
MPNRLRKNAIFPLFLFLLLFISWLVLFCIKPVVFYPDSETYQATAAHLTDPSQVRPILFPLVLRITGTLHLKLSIICFLTDVFGLVCFLGLLSPRKQLFTRTNLGIGIGFFLLPAIWSYCGTCLTESILPAVEIWIVILLVWLFFPRRENSLVLTILYSVAIALLASLLKPWIMLYVLGCSVLFVLLAWLSRSFRGMRRSTLVLLIISLGAFAFSYRYNISKSPSSANIGFLIVSSGKVEDLKTRYQAVKDTTREEARFMKSLIDDIELINTKYNGDPYDPPMKDLKVLKVTEREYVDTVNKAFKVAYLQRGRDVAKLTRLSARKYVKDIHIGLNCLDQLYGPSLPLLQNAGVNTVILLSVAFIAFWLGRHRLPGLPGFSGLAGARLIFAGVLIFCSFFFALFLCVAGGVELPRTVLPAVFFQLLALSYLIMNREDVLPRKEPR